MQGEKEKIKKIQSYLRVFRSKLLLKKIKVKVHVQVKMDGKIIYTIKKILNEKTTLTVENIDNRDREEV